MKMKQYKTLFVPLIPESLEEGVLYVCISYNVSVHLCACGCKSEIITPISRKHGWILSYDGDNASLAPSIGNGAYPCRSHYFLKNGYVQWLPPINNDISTVPVRRKERSGSNSLLKRFKVVINRILRN